MPDRGNETTSLASVYDRALEKRVAQREARSVPEETQQKIKELFRKGDKLVGDLLHPPYIDDIKDPERKKVEALFSEYFDVLTEEEKQNSQLIDTLQRKYYQDRKKLFYFILKINHLRKIIARLKIIKQDLQAQMRDKLNKGNLSGWIAKIESKIQTYEDFYERIPFLDKTAFVNLALLKTRQYRRQIPSGIIELDYVLGKEEEVVTALKTHKIAALVGETGTGKTQLARRIARKLGTNKTGKPYYFVAGHAFMSKEDLLDSLQLVADKTPAEKIPQLVQEAQEKYKTLHPEATKEELQTVAEIIKGQASRPQMVTKKVLGPVLQAAQEGKIVIIDEFNYLPPGLLAALNDLIAARPGDQVMGVTITNGFGIILTGNISTSSVNRYLERKNIDPALANRINGGMIEYGFPPQDLDSSLEASITTENDKNPKQRELFRLGLALIADSKGIIKVPNNLIIKRLWDLSRDISLLWAIFAGKPLSQEIKLPVDELEGINYPISLRNFIQIVENWHNDGFQYPLDWYLYQNLIKSAVLNDPQSAGKMFLILKERDWFRQSTWDKNIQIDSKTDYKMHLLKDVGKNNLRIKNSQDEWTIISPQHLAELYWGKDINTVKENIDSDKNRQSVEILRHVLQLKEQVENLRKKRSRLEEAIGFLCEEEMQPYIQFK